VENGALRLAVGGEPLFLALPQASFTYRASGVSRHDGLLTAKVEPNSHPLQLINPNDNPQDLAYGTFLGGTAHDEAFAIALDDNDRATIAGTTESYNFLTTPGSFDTGCSGYCWDAFISRLSADGSTLVYSTFLGGSGGEGTGGVALDDIGRTFVTGQTLSADFPVTSSAFDRDCNDYSCNDAFVASLSVDSSALVYSTYLGGQSEDGAFDIAVDDAGHAIATGYTRSGDFPTTPDAFDSSYNGGGSHYGDAFLARLTMFQPAVVASWTGQPPTVDGNLNDWGEWSPLVLDRDTALYVATQPPGSPSPTPADNSAELRALWTGANLYFAIFVRDDWIVNDSQYVWQDDEIELAFVEAWDPTPNNGDTHQYTVNADGRITDFGNPANPVPIQAVAAPVSGGWNVEVRIPASHLFGANLSLTPARRWPSI
jgi:hypothetical protein